MVYGLHEYIAADGQVDPSAPRWVMDVTRRREYLAPLFAYLRVHHYIAGSVAREAGERGGYPVTPILLAQMKRGERIILPWFIAACCAVIERSVAEVMGAEWVARYGADGAGGSEEAPVGQPRTYTRADGVHATDAA